MSMDLKEHGMEEKKRFQLLFAEKLHKLKKLTKLKLEITSKRNLKPKNLAGLVLKRLSKLLPKKFVKLNVSKC